MDLTIKYRPKTLNSLYGNDNTKEFIKSLFISNTFPACTIIYGASNGVGKSSLAYILSRMFSCENLQDEINPCGVCSKCQAMDKMYLTGDTVNGLNVFKYDIGLKTSSEYINQIITSIKRPPTSKHKIIHIDELQLLSFNEQEKLNNPIEFCNDKTHIIITTTNLNGISKSIKSRSTILTLNKPTIEEQVNLADIVLTFEGHTNLLNKSELKTLVEISETPRMLLKNLQDIIVDKNRYKQLTLSSGKDITEYVKYFEAINSGVVDLILYIESIKEPISFLTGLSTFIYNCICSRYGSVYYKSSAIKDTLIYNDSSLVDVIKLLSNFNSKNEANVKEMLLVIGFELNKSIIPTITKTDDVNTLHHVPNEDSKQVERELNKILATNFGKSGKSSITKEDL